MFVMHDALEGELHQRRYKLPTFFHIERSQRSRIFFAVRKILQCVYVKRSLSAKFEVFKNDNDQIVYFLDALASLDFKL